MATNVFTKLGGLINYNHFLMLLLIGSILLLSIVLAGCTSSVSAIRNIYLTSLSYQIPSPVQDSSQVNFNISQTFAALVNGTSTSFEVRTGYFGLCVRNATRIWSCSRNPSKLTERFKPDQDPLNLIWASAKFKNEIVLSELIIVATVLAGLSSLVLISFPEVDETGSEREVKLFASRPASQMTLTMMGFASLLVMISIIWQHTASVASATTIQDMAYGTVHAKVGVVAMALGWSGLALLILSTLGMLIMILSIQILDILTDE